MRTFTLLILLIIFQASAAFAQEGKWNFNVGGGVGFPVGNLSKYINNGGNFEVGGGPNFASHLGLVGEFGWQDLPIKTSVLNQIGAPGGSARQYSVTANLIFRVPTGERRLGFYGIGGGGWYRRSGELTRPVIVPGTVCPGFWLWWGGCVSGLFPANQVIASSTSDAFGGNIGGGLTIRLSGNLKFYAQVRYTYAPHAQTSTEVVPLTFGIRW